MKKFIIINLLIMGVFVMLNFNCFVPAMTNSQEARLAKINGSTQYKDGKFIGGAIMPDLSVGDYAKMTFRFLFEKNAQEPDVKLPVIPVDISYYQSLDSRQLNSTWLGHSSLMIHINGYKILTDPVFEKRVSLVGPTRFNGELPFDIEQISYVDLVIISHDHYDHLNKFSIQFLNQKTKKFLVPLGVGKKLESWGVAQEKIVELDWWEEYQFDETLMLCATPAQHFSGRGILDRNKTLWASWVIKSKDYSLFFSGDSGYFTGFKTIGEKYGPFNMTFMECGAYDQMWHPVHMFPEETVQAHIDLKGEILHPIHWGTFNLSLHPWYDPMQRLTKAALSQNIKIATPMAGESIVFGSHNLGTSWWENAKTQQKDSITLKGQPISGDKI
ncbi:MAG: hypothetical protein GY729_07350 [Desulfobacteraceae bacterium]|nr:hypothetical protein [Desulfobacteraceae bacterium]